MLDDQADDKALAECFRQDMNNELTSIVDKRKRVRDEAKRRAERRAVYAPWGGIFDRKELEKPEVFAVHETATA